MNSRLYTGQVQKLRVDINELGLLDLKEVMVTVLTESQFKQVKRYHKIVNDNGTAILLIRENGKLKARGKSEWSKFWAKFWDEDFDKKK